MAQEGGSNPGALEVEGAEGILPYWDVLRGHFLGDVCNGFNNLSRLSILWNVRHCCYRVVGFLFNWCRHNVQLLVCRPGEVYPEALLSR